MLRILAYHQQKSEQELMKHLKPLVCMNFVKKRLISCPAEQKQRVAVAGIIAMKPQCIVLDEQLRCLIQADEKEVIETVKKLNREENITIVLINALYG